MHGLILMGGSPTTKLAHHMFLKARSADEYLLQQSLKIFDDQNELLTGWLVR